MSTKAITLGILLMYAVCAIILASESKPLTKDATVTMTLPLVEGDIQSIRKIRNLTADDFARAHGRWLMTQSELLELTKAIKLMWGQTQPDIGVVQAVLLSPAEQLRRRAARIEQEERDQAWALAVLEKWEKRAEQLKD